MPAGVVAAMYCRIPGHVTVVSARHSMILTAAFGGFGSAKGITLENMHRVHLSPDDHD